MSSWDRPQDVVEKALAASTADGQVAFVVESSEANLRWANNSLTTNGSMRSRQVVAGAHSVSRPPNSGAVVARHSSRAISSGSSA